MKQQLTGKLTATIALSIRGAALLLPSLSCCLKPAWLSSFICTLAKAARRQSINQICQVCSVVAAAVALQSVNLQHDLAHVCRSRKERQREREGERKRAKRNRAKRVQSKADEAKNFEPWPERI